MCLSAKYISKMYFSNKYISTLNVLKYIFKYFLGTIRIRCMGICIVGLQT